MTPMPARHFDMLDFVKKSKELGVKEDLAEYQARQFEKVIDIASAVTKEEFNAHELATKTDIKQLEMELRTDIKQLEVDLKTDIKQLEADLKTNIKQLEIDLKTDIKQLEVKMEHYRYDSLKFTIWTGIGVIVFIGGMLVKGFHWIG
jgi:hypothetical protein